MKEIIYTAIFAALGILILCLLFFMFVPGRSKTRNTGRHYTPGIYTSSVTLNNTELEVEVSVNESQIDSIRISNLSETVTTMYPLLQPAIEDLADQILKTQSLEHLTLPEDNPYTSWLLLQAVEAAIKKAAVQ